MLGLRGLFGVFIAFLFVGRSKAWVNQVNQKCKGAELGDQVLIQRSNPNRTCERDRIEVVRRGGGMTVSTCQLGPFTVLPDEQYEILKERLRG